jgi:septal ring factor EnvC (AmiA/AmiB activator)
MYNVFMGYFTVIGILSCAIIVLSIYLWEKPKELRKEIERLRRSIASDGMSFEQFEYKISNLKREISRKRASIKTGRIYKKDIDSYLKELEKKIDGITNDFFLKK